MATPTTTANRTSQRSLLGQVEAGEHGDRKQPGDDELAPLPQPPGRDQRVQGGDEDGGEEGHRHRRQRGAPARGRGSPPRAAAGVGGCRPATTLPTVTTNIATTATSRCRQRRQITSTASVAHHKANIPSGAGFESTPAARATWVSQGVRIATNTLRTTWSATSAATAIGRTFPTSTPATTATPTSSSQRLPEVCSCRGSGGGSPDGRRLRRTRAAVEAVGAGDGRSSRGAPASSGVEAVTTPPLVGRAPSWRIVATATAQCLACSAGACRSWPA